MLTVDHTNKPKDKFHPVEVGPAPLMSTYTGAKSDPKRHEEMLLPMEYVRTRQSTIGSHSQVYS